MDDEKTAALVRVALANYDVRELRVQRRYLEERCAFIKCACYQSGFELLDEIKRGGRYEAVVLGSQMEDMGELEFITRLRSMTSRPALILFGDGGRHVSAASCLRPDGNSYIMRRSELEELADELSRMAGSRALDIRALCRSLYAAWGVSRPDVNCAYLTSAVNMACGTDERLALRKELLRLVSEEYGVSVAAVDSGIRRMIGELEKINAPGWRGFKRESGLESEKITTGRLIYAVRGKILKD